MAKWFSLAQLPLLVPRDAEPGSLVFFEQMKAAIPGGDSVNSEPGRICCGRKVGGHRPSQRTL